MTELNQAIYSNLTSSQAGNIVGQLYKDNADSTNQHVSVIGVVIDSNMEYGYTVVLSGTDITDMTTKIEAIPTLPVDKRSDAYISPADFCEREKYDWKNGGKLHMQPIQCQVDTAIAGNMIGFAKKEGADLKLVETTTSEGRPMYNVTFYPKENKPALTEGLKEISQGEAYKRTPDYIDPRSLIADSTKTHIVSRLHADLNGLDAVQAGNVYGYSNSKEAKGNLSIEVTRVAAVTYGQVETFNINMITDDPTIMKNARKEAANTEQGEYYSPVRATKVQIGTLQTVETRVEENGMLVNTSSGPARAPASRGRY